MNLQFDSISELEQFLMFSAHIGKAFAVAPREAAATQPVQHVDPAADFYVAPTVETEMTPGQSVAHFEAQTAINEAHVAATVSANAEIAKRKRRTKAEMEAARAKEASAANAEAAPAGGSATTSAAAASVQLTPAGDNPFAVASPATQAILEAPNQSAATLAGMAAMQSNPPSDEQPAAPRVIESIEHLRACQAFIQAHGMTKYNESFKDGLNANIAAYTPEQRAQHIAILEQIAA